MEGTVANTVQPGDTITANTATIGWTSHNPGWVHPAYDDSSTTPSIAVLASFSVAKAADVANVTIGDTITYEATVTVIEGTTNNLQFVDTLPLGTTYVAASAGVSSANGMTISPLMVTGPVGQVLTIDIASVVNPGNVDNAAVADANRLPQLNARSQQRMALQITQQLVLQTVEHFQTAAGDGEQLDHRLLADLGEVDVEACGYSSARWRKTSLVTIVVTAAENRYPLSSRARRVESSVWKSPDCNLRVRA